MPSQGTHLLSFEGEGLLLGAHVVIIALLRCVIDDMCCQTLSFDEEIGQ